MPFPSGTLITFLPSLSGQTITLTHADGDMEIPGALTIDATALPGGITVSGNNASRHFDVRSGKSLTLRGFTLTGGNGGGNDSRRGGAILNFGGNVTLTHCTLSGNTSTYGGAISNTATLTLTHCTLSGNTTSLDGGAIINEFGTVTLTHCTLSGNTASRDGGAIFNLDGTVTLDNSIVAGNASGSGSGADIRNDDMVTRVGANLVQSLRNDSGGSVTGSGTISTADPKLSPLGYFGGPVQTMHPLIGSPAIDAAGTTNPGGTDARGLPRFVNGNEDLTAQLDIGAVEVGRGAFFPVTTLADEDDGDLFDSFGAGTSLRESINYSAAGSIIVFSPALAGQTITLTQNQLSIPANANLFIDASNLSAPVTISGNNASRVFNIPAGATVAMHSLKIVNGKAPDGATVIALFRAGPGEDGGGILNAGALSLFSSTLSHNQSGHGGNNFNPGNGGNGGAIYNSGLVHLAVCTLFGNAAGNGGSGPNGSQGGSGGGIFSSTAFGLNSCTLFGNTAGSGNGNSSTGGSGGGINCGSASLDSCTLVGNRTGTGSSQGNGGGINGTQLTLRHTLIAQNTQGTSTPNDVTGTSVNFFGANLLSIDATGTPSGPAPIINPNPLLAPLGDYGGPTQTVALLPGSPARNAASGSTRLTDQRGFPIFGTADIGAYETQIGPIADVTMVENTAPPTQNFTVGQVGTLTATSSNTALVPNANIALGGSGSSRSITATPAVTQLGSSTITLTDSLTGETQGYTFTVTLDPAFVVSNTDPSGPGSLTQALINATNAAGPNTITFASGFANIMSLTGEFLITDTEPVAIDATSVSGGLTLLAAGPGFRHFQVPLGKTLTLRGLTLQFGSANGDGGSIYNEGTLHLERCALMNSQSPFSGGAVACAGAASVFTATGCNFSFNAANGNGGAINCVSGAVTLAQCTITDNSTPASLSAGGLQMNGGSLNLIHCTLSTNSGGLTGGLYLESVPVANITHSIIAGNTKTNSTPADIFANASPIIPSGANLIGNNEGAESVFPAGPLVGTAAAPLNPDLSPLGNYGGPTATMPPNVNSPAIDQASTLSPALTTDQRGEPRPLGVRPDLGAVESSVILVTTPVDELDAPGALGNGVSLREAVRDVPLNGTIGFDRAIFNSLTTNTITLTKGPLNPQRNCTLSGALNPGGINVLHTPTITAQPLPLSLSSGATANFTLSVTNLSGGLAYEWRKNGTSNGITTPALTLVNVQEADEAVYDVNISEAVAPGTLTQNDVILNVFAMTSQPAALIVDGSNVTIQRHPSSAMLALGSVHTLSVVAIGPAAPALTYQWFKAGRAIPGATKSSYVIPKVALSHAGAYTCVVKSGTTSPGVTSTTAEIGVVDTSLRTMSLKEGSKFTATVVAAGNGLSYDWNKNGLGDTTKTLTINSVSMDDADLVQCIVSLPSAFGMKGGRVRLFVSNAAPGLVTPLAPPTAYIGQNYFYQLPLVNTPGAPAVSFSVSGALPSGLTFNKTTGILSGRPTVTKSAGYALSFKAINASGSSAPATATLQVIAVPPTILGSFSGPLGRSALNGNLGGRFDLTVSKTGTFSGSIMFGALKRSFRSQLVLSAGQGDAILRGNIAGITLADRTPVTAYVEFFAAEQIARLTLVHPNGTLLGTGWRKTTPAVAQTLNFRIDPGSVAGAPQGYGYGSFKISATNSLRISGRLPDGSPLVGSTFMGPGGQVLVFQLLYGNKGSLVSQDQLSGNLSWFKPQTTTGTVYRDGFGPLNVTLDGGTYTPPAAGQLVMPANVSLFFYGGGLTPDFSQPVTIANPSLTGLTNTAKPVLPLANNTKITKFDIKTGLITGSFQEGTRLAPWNAQLVKIDDTIRAYGYFLLPTGVPNTTTSPKLSGLVILGVP